MRNIRTILLLLTLLAAPFCAPNAEAQEEDEYAFEVGAMGGGSFYLGDANFSFYKGLKPAGGVYGRWNINPRQALKFNVLYAGIKGDATTLATKYPDTPGQTWQFDSSLWDISLTYELHFWGYGIGGTYKGHRRVTPYLSFGLGMTAGKGVTTANLPIGFGVKCKVAPRWNVGLDWAVHFSFSDNLDGISDPYNISSGMLKNKDSYCLTMLYVSYDFGPKCISCHNSKNYW